MSKPGSGYRAAIEWIAQNDDNEWIEEYLETKGEGSESLSVTASMVCDLHDKEGLQLARAIQAARKRLGIGA